MGSEDTAYPLQRIAVPLLGERVGVRQRYSELGTSVDGPAHAVPMADTDGEGDAVVDIHGAAGVDVEPRGVGVRLERRKLRRQNGVARRAASVPRGRGVVRIEALG